MESIESVQQIEEQINEIQPEATIEPEFHVVCETDETEKSPVQEEEQQIDDQNECEKIEVISSPVQEEQDQQNETSFDIFPNFDTESDSSPGQQEKVEEQPIPKETPLTSKRSLIPVTMKKLRVTKEVFQTPCLKNSNIQPEIFESEIKPKPEKVEVPQPKRVSKKELNQFIRRTQTNEEQKMKKLMKARKEEIEREQQELGILHQRKSLTRSEIMKLNERLVPQTPSVRRASEAPENIPPPQTPCNNPKIFARLYELSTVKKAKPESQIPVQAPSTCVSVKSNHIAAQNEIAKIKSVVGEVDECPREHMESILRQLDIIDKTVTQSELRVINKVINNCQINEETFSAKKLESKMIRAVVQPRRQRKFQMLVINKLAIARANEKIVAKVEEEIEEEPVGKSVTMQKDTLARLLASKPTVEKEEEVEEEYSLISDRSKQILAKSTRIKDVQHLSLEERNVILTQKRDDEIHKMEEELKQNEEKEMVAPKNLGVMPEFYDKLPEDRKKRTKVAPEAEIISFKPQTNNYDDYKRQQEKMRSKQTTPVGWEESIARLRLARQEREEIQEALEPRAPLKVIKNHVNFAEWKQKNTRRSRRRLQQQQSQTQQMVEEISPYVDSQTAQEFDNIIVSCNADIVE